jgi:hypothetical protein
LANASFAVDLLDLLDFDDFDDFDDFVLPDPTDLSSSDFFFGHSAAGCPNFLQ